MPGTPEIPESESSARTNASTTNHSHTSQGGVISSAATASVSHSSQTHAPYRHRRHEAWVTHAHGHGRQQSVREALVSGLQSQRINAAFGLLRGIEFRTKWCSQHELSTRTFSLDHAPGSPR